jgi:hypothetical protein
MITLKSIFNEGKFWSKSNQNQFLALISDNIIIGIRSILSNQTFSNEEKLDAIKWLNEFNHRINNLRLSTLKEDKIKNLVEHMKYYAEQNHITKSEIPAISQSAYNQFKFLNRKAQSIELSIHDFLTSNAFLKRPGMYLGDMKISTLRTFTIGYEYALEVRNIEDEDERPELGKFHDWIAKYYNWNESTAGWKNIILEEYNGNEEQAFQKFFELYDQFINE